LINIINRTIKQFLHLKKLKYGLMMNDLKFITSTYFAFFIFNSSCFEEEEEVGSTPNKCLDVPG